MPAMLGYLGNLFDRRREKETFKAEIYQQLIDYPFEDVTLRGSMDYETYLTQMYGDYMQLPPEDSRQDHSVVEGYWNVLCDKKNSERFASKKSVFLQLSFLHLRQWQ